MVAVGDIELTAAELASQVPLSGQPWTSYQDNPGTNSPSGCGRNSDYRVWYDITQTYVFPLGITSSPAVARTPEHLDVFWIGRDGSVWSNWWDQNINDGSWQAPFEIAGPMRDEASAGAG